MMQGFLFVSVTALLLATPLHAGMSEVMGVWNLPTDLGVEGVDALSSTLELLIGQLEQSYRMKSFPYQNAEGIAYLARLKTLQNVLRENPDRTTYVKKEAELAIKLMKKIMPKAPKRWTAEYKKLKKRAKKVYDADDEVDQELKAEFGDVEGVDDPRQQSGLARLIGDLEQIVFWGFSPHDPIFGAWLDALKKLAKPGKYDDKKADYIKKKLSEMMPEASKTAEYTKPGVDEMMPGVFETVAHRMKERFDERKAEADARKKLEESAIKREVARWDAANKVREELKGAGGDPDGYIFPKWHSEGSDDTTAKVSQGSNAATKSPTKKRGSSSPRQSSSRGRSSRTSPIMKITLV